MNDFLALLGRIALATLFIWSGAMKISGFSHTAASIASKGLAMPALLTALTIFIELGLGLALVIGWRTRLVGVVIALWLIPTTLLFHAFWSASGAAVMPQQVNFFKNLSIFGGMLMVAAFGPGAYSVDRSSGRS